jgi:hypothetical protein
MTVKSSSGKRSQYPWSIFTKLLTDPTWPGAKHLNNIRKF